MTSNDVGKQTERMVVRYLRGAGFAGVERRVRTGYRTAARTSPDHGDLTGMPGLCVQVKSLRPATRAERSTRDWLWETERQRQASGAVLGLLIVRRWGTEDVGRWWVFLDLQTLLDLHSGRLGSPRPVTPGWDPVPVRMELSDAVAMLRSLGWAPDLEAVT